MSSPPGERVVLYRHRFGVLLSLLVAFSLLMTEGSFPGPGSILFQLLVGCYHQVHSNRLVSPSTGLAAGMPNVINIKPLTVLVGLSGLFSSLLSKHVHYVLTMYNFPK